MLDSQFFVALAFSFPPALVGLVGLCLLPWFPRAGRGTAAAGLILLMTAPLMDLLLFSGLDFLLRSAELNDLSILLSYVDPFMTATALLLLGLAATRGIRQVPVAHQGPPGPPGPDTFPPPPGPVQPGYPQHGPHGGA